MAEQLAPFCKAEPQYYNVYDLANDFSPEAEAFLQQWSTGWTSSHAPTPRDKLNNLIQGLEAEDVVLRSLRAKHPNDDWTYNDPNRLIVSINIPIYTHDKPDLINKFKQTVEVKQIDDKYWDDFGSQSFIFGSWRKFHDADAVICINSSHTLMCQLDLVHVDHLNKDYMRCTAPSTVHLH